MGNDQCNVADINSRFVSAPEGHIIKLDFRDYFQMENDCKNDFLEVRDGLYGYDKQIGNRAFCGFEFPPPMQSTDRYLWIHFKSDENIEYKGFKAVYEFVPRPTACKYYKLSIFPLSNLIIDKKCLEASLLQTLKENSKALV